MTKAERRRYRYHNDPEFRAKERERGRDYFRRTYVPKREGKTGPIPKSLEERLNARIKKEGNCWVAVDRDGHFYKEGKTPTIALDGGKKIAIFSHCAWKLYKGELPEQKFYLRRTCQTLHCVNPDHHEIELAATNEIESREKHSKRASERYYRLLEENPPPPKETSEERFWKLVDKKGDDDCWDWTGYYVNPNLKTEPLFSLDKKMISARKYAWTISHETPISRIRSICGNMGCVNPRHLYSGSLADLKIDQDNHNLQKRQKATIRASRYYNQNKNKRKSQSALLQLKYKILAMNYLGGACYICGETHPNALDFHHRDSSTKLFNLSQKQLCSHNKIGIDAIRDELDKCDLICSNCHRKTHAIISENQIQETKQELSDSSWGDFDGVSLYK